MATVTPWPRAIVRSTPRRALGRGFSLLETLLAVSILLLVLSLTFSLLLDAQARIGREGRRAVDAVAEDGLEWLRADVRRANDFGGVAGMGWSSLPLELSGHPQGGISWEVVAGELRRATFPPGELVPSSTRLVLRGVAAMRWRSVPTLSRAVEVELTLVTTSQFGARGVGAGQREDLMPDLQTMRIVVMPRNVGGRTSW
ncbi:MAG: hypothetical protein AAGC60_16810 [Acidobacteriota bacterium]